MTTCKIYKETTLSDDTVIKWLWRSNCGDFSVEDELRSG